MHTCMCVCVYICMYIESVRVRILWCPSCHLQSLFLFTTLCSLLPRIFVFPHFDVESTLTSYLAGLSGPALSQYPLSRPTSCPSVLCLLLSTHIAGYITCFEILSSTSMCNESLAWLCCSKICLDGGDGLCQCIFSQPFKAHSWLMCDGWWMFSKSGTCLAFQVIFPIPPREPPVNGL